MAHKAHTLAEVKAINQAKGFHHFDRDTLKFFKETMGSWKVSNHNGAVEVIRKRDGKIWIFNPKTGDIRLKEWRI